MPDFSFASRHDTYPADAWSDPTETGRLVGGRYRLQQQLGHGGMASVWLAQDTHLNRGAAVKLLDPGFHSDPVALERLRREAHWVAKLAHPNIVAVYDFDIAEDAAYLVMELVEGRSVTELIATQGPLPVEQAAWIAAQICDALAAAHAAGVVHRDIKPSNVLVGPTGVVKVCDFGIARLQRAAGQAALTNPGAVVGTSHYMAPEQASGESVDGRADLYAVGCLLYTMLVGGPPFRGTDAIDVLDQHLNEPPVPLRAHRDDVPAALHGLVGELLAKDRGNRPPTAWSVRDRLLAITGRPGADQGDAFPVAEDWPTEGSLVSATAVWSGDGDTSGRHRAFSLGAPAVAWYRRWVSGWVAMLVAGALVTSVVAAIVLVRGGGEPDPTVTAAAPPAVELPDPEPTSDEPTDSTDLVLPTPSPSVSPTATARPVRPTAAQQVTALAAVLQGKVDAGQLQQKAARGLLRDLNEVNRRLSVGDTAEAADRFAEFRQRVAELRSDGKLTGALPDLDRIAASINGG